ncbi:20689_t:CDS:2, partial [Gigaspora margarita]
MIMENEWTAVAGIINILKPFNDITNYILDSSYSMISIIYLTLNTLYNALLKEYVDEDDSIYDTDKIDFDTIDDISMFNLEKVMDEDEEFEQIRLPATTTDLVKHIKIIISKLFARLMCQDYLRLEYNQIISDKSLGLSLSEATLDLSGLFISIVQQNALCKNEIDQYLMMETIQPLDNPL